jgi:hypothetical protein
MLDFADDLDAGIALNLVDGSGENSWPIAGYSYLIIDTQAMADCLKARKLLEYIQWSLTEDFPAQRAVMLGYGSPPPAVRAAVLDRLSEMTCQGESLLSL